MSQTALEVKSPNSRSHSRKHLGIVSTIVSFLLIAFVYFALSAHIYGDVLRPSAMNYYPYLLDAMTHGRVNVTPPFDYDLSFFNGNWYLYWGPGPVLFVLPFFLKWGAEASDVLFTLVAGVLNVILFALALDQCKNYFGVRLSRTARWTLILSFAFASPNLFLSVGGYIWFSEQIIATFYLLAFYYLYFKFLNNDQHPWLLILAALCFNLAWLSRYTLIFNGLLFVYVLFHYRLRKRPMPGRLAPAVGAVVALFGGIALYYNYLKFGNPIETGQQYIVPNGRYEDAIRTQDFLGLHYLKHNLRVYFLNWIPISFRQDFITVDMEGNGVFSVYPALLFLFAWVFRLRAKLTAELRWFLPVAASVVFLGITFLMLYFATGWAQFGNRYFFDVLPLLFLGAIFVMSYVPAPLQRVVLVYGASVNMIGTLWMYR